MTTAHLSAVPTFGDFDDDTDDPIPRTSFTMIARRRRGATTEKVAHQLTAWAETDAGSLLVMLGGAETDAARQYRGVQAFMMRALVDDDGVPQLAGPRLLTDDQLVADPAQLEPADEDDDVDPDPIPDDDHLARMGKAALVALAGDYDLDTGGQKLDLVDDARWRLVFPDGRLADDHDFDTLLAAQEYAELNPSSRRLFFQVAADPEQTVKLEALTDIVGHIAGKAAGRPTKPSGGSSRSRRTRGRRART